MVIGVPGRTDGGVCGWVGVRADLSGQSVRVREYLVINRWSIVFQSVNYMGDDLIVTTYKVWTVQTFGVC